MKQIPTKVVLDTNILVAAGFNPESHSARLVSQIRQDKVDLVWQPATKAESRHVINKIPPLEWSEFEAMFEPENEHKEQLDEASDWLMQIEDPADRKFAALAQQAGAVLISNDDHLLAVRNQLPAQVLTPTEFIERL